MEVSIQLPLYCIMYSSTEEPDGSFTSRGTLYVNSGEQGCVAVFTSPDAAENFVTENRVDGAHIVTFDQPEDFAKFLLLESQVNGPTHFVVDPKGLGDRPAAISIVDLVTKFVGPPVSAIVLEFEIPDDISDDDALEQVSQTVLSLNLINRALGGSGLKIQQTSVHELALEEVQS